MELCPSLNYHMASFKLKAIGASFGYGYNIHLSAPEDKPAISMVPVRNPSQLAVLADAAQVNTFQPPASPDRPMLEEFYYVSAATNEATAHFRHRGRADMVFVDGHAGNELPVPGSIDLRLPGQIIGRLRAELLVVTDSPTAEH